MGRYNKDITISLRMDDDTKDKLDSLCKTEERNLLDMGLSFLLPTTNSKMLRCLIEAVYEMPEEEKKELLKKHYSKY